MISLYVTFGYWMAYFSQGDEIDKGLPLILNLCLHGGNALVLFSSRYVTGFPYYRPSSFWENVKFGVLSGVGYNLVMATHRWRFGFEVYSIYGDLDTTQKLLFNLLWVVFMPICSAGLQRYYEPPAIDYDNDCDTISEACTEMTEFE